MIVRTLLVLIKRQIIDNAFYFALALIVCAVLIVAVIVLALTEDRTHLSLYALALMVVVPVFFCAGSYTLGLLQAHHDRLSGVATMLTVLPPGRTRILLARLVVGVLVILTLLGPLVIGGAVLWKLLGPPVWLFHSWLADTFIGMSLTAFASYCLGLRAGQSTETITRGLQALPLTFILLLLIVIKGFGWPLLVVLLPYLGVSLLLYCKPAAGRAMRTAVTGLMALVLLVIPLSFGRYVCDGQLACRIDAEAKISPSGLLALEIENDPNVKEHSTASSSFQHSYWAFPMVGEVFESCFHKLGFGYYTGAYPYLLEESGIVEYFESLPRGKRYSYYPDGWWRRPIRLVQLEEVAGQLICRREDIRSYTETQTWNWKGATELYFGPKGTSSTPDNRIGRFGSPIVYFTLGRTRYRFDSPPLCVVYDASVPCFFAINLKNQSIRKGPRLPGLSVHPTEPDLSSNLLSVRFNLPSGFELRLPSIDYNPSTYYLPIVSKSGRIDLLDPSTLELHGPAGYLPRPKTLFGWGSPKPGDLGDWAVELITVAPYNESRIAGRTKTEYLGLIAASLSRQGTWASVAVFDKDGRLVNSAYSKAGFLDAPWGPALAGAKFLFESLHPPLLTLASYFTAYSFEARSTHRALFLMPNSFVAMVRDYQGNIFYALLIVALLMAPGLLFAGVLAWRVERDAARLGLLPKARRLWLLGTLAFGLVAYITYRLTRPKVALVTCANCGHPRRPDMEKCHRCGSDWHVPELTPPDWRVLDGDAKERTSGYQETR